MLFSLRLSLIRQDRLHHIHIVQLAGTGIDGLQQLVHLLIAHLLAQVREDVAELAHADEARQVLVEDLEPPAVVFGLARVAEAAGPVEDLGEGVEVDWERGRWGVSLMYFLFFCFCFLLSLFLLLVWWDCGKGGSEVVPFPVWGGWRKNLQSPPAWCSKSLISARVGFCPQARRRSPKLSSWTRPLPRLSKREKASLKLVLCAC